MSATARAQTKPKDDPIRDLPPTFSHPPQTEEPDLDQSRPETVGPFSLTQTTPGRGPRLSRLAGDGGGFPDSAGPSPAPAGTRTGMSSAGDDAPRSTVTTAEATALVIGVLGVVVAIGGALVRWQAKRQLRKPTTAESKAIAAPIAKILMRRADLSLLGPDIGDALQAAAATGAYIGNGPLLQPLEHVVDDGVPDDLQETP